MRYFKKKLHTVGLTDAESIAYGRALAYDHAVADLARRGWVKKSVVDSEPLSVGQTPEIEAPIIAACTNDPDAKIVAVFSDDNTGEAKAVVVSQQSPDAWYVRFRMKDGMPDVVSVTEIEGVFVGA
jgi:hypothetical protein